MHKKQKFAIKKLSIGVVSVCIGFGFMTARPVQAEENANAANVTETSSAVSVSTVPVVNNDTNLVDETAVQPAKGTATEAGNESVIPAEALPVEPTTTNATVPAETVATTTNSQADATALKQYFDNEKATKAPTTVVEGALSDQYAQAIQDRIDQDTENLALSDVKQQKTKLDVVNGDFVKYVVPLANAQKAKEGFPANPAQWTEVQKARNAEIIKEVTPQALANANAELSQLDEYEAIAPEVKNLFTKEVLAEAFSKSKVTVPQFVVDLPAYLRGMYHLTQQYDIAQDFVKNLVLDPKKIDASFDNSQTPLERLKQFGGTRTDNNPSQTFMRNKGYLGESQALFTSRGMDKITGAKNVAELIEKLAKATGKAPNVYMAEQSRAIIYEGKNGNVFETLKTSRPDLLLPILSRGSGLYVGSSPNSISLGMTASYTDLYSADELKPHQQGTAASQTPFIKPYVDAFANFTNFLNDQPKQAVGFNLALDTMNVGYTTNNPTSRKWSEKEGVNAALAVRQFMTPMGGLWRAYTNTQFLGGQSYGPELLVSYESRLMAKDMSGVTLFTHEMTHGNEAAIWGKKRPGQGVELYARGLFEDIVNTPGESAFEPVFNLNTAIPIGDSANRIQSQTPQTTKADLANYTKNLLELITYLEAMEAKAVSDLGVEDQYFNQVTQVAPPTTDTLHKPNNSTNDAVAPKTQVAASGDVQALLRELVSDNLVSGQFTPRGVSPFIQNLSTNQYDNVDLLNSFYGSTEQADKNASGDVSWTRKAYEVLGWFGWDAFTDFISDKYKSDTEATQGLLKGTGYKNWTELKTAKYNEALEKQAQNHLWDNEQLLTDLKAAVQADLVGIQKTRTEYQTALTSPTVDRALGNINVQSVKAVSTVKEKILNQALKASELRSSVLETPSNELDIVYVKNGGTGDGSTASSPVSTLADALAKVKNGGIIHLVGDVTQREALQVDKAITIDSEPNVNGALKLNEDIVFNQAVQLKNHLQIHSLGEGGRSVQLTFKDRVTIDDTVTTEISPQQADQRPSILLDAEKQALTASIAGGKFQALTTKGDATVELSKNVFLIDGVKAQTGKATVTSTVNQVTAFAADPAALLHVEIKAAQPAMVRLTNVENLALTDKAKVSLAASTVKNAVTLQEGTVLNAQGNSLQLQKLSGPGTYQFDEAASLTASVLENAPQIEVNHTSLAYTDGKNYVYSDSGDAKVLLKQLGVVLEKNGQNDYPYIKPYRVFYEFKAATAENDAIFNVDDFDNYKPANDGETEPLAPQKISDKVSSNGKVWTFDRWLLKKEDSKTYVYYGLWQPNEAETPQVSRNLRHEFTFMGSDAANFDHQKVSKPADRVVYEGDTVTLPSQPATSLVESLDKMGEWLFQGWQPAKEQVVGKADLVFTGLWKFMAYLEIPAPLICLADDTATVGSPNRVTNPGKAGKQSSDGRVVLEPISRVMYVATKPLVETIETVLPTIFQADKDRDFGQPNQVIRLGKPQVTTKTTTYRIVNGQAVANTPTVTEVEGLAEIQSVAAKEELRKIVEDLAEVVENDPTILVGSPDAIVSGRPKVTEIRTSYQVDSKTGQVTKTVSEPAILDAGQAPLRKVGTKAYTLTKPIVKPIETAIPTNAPTEAEKPEALVTEEAIPFETLRQEDANLAKGKEILVQEGKEGLRQIISVDGQILSNEIIQQPQVKIIKVGTKETTVKVQEPTVDQPKVGKTAPTKTTANMVTQAAAPTAVNAKQQELPATGQEQEFYLLYAGLCLLVALAGVELSTWKKNQA